MLLKKLEINGFKSFANKTEFFFGSGITAIVGPNGSGKSNVADAIRWALGEQSAKTLRGKKNEDVIFAGGIGKSQIGMASVFLCFDNTDRKFPIESDEVSVARKVFRDGTGNYFLNESKVRLSDLSQFLAESGIGKGDSAVVRQGMADAILNASPSQRRIILEESAGIKHLRIKREQSERKLEATRQNIVRIQDLLNEIEPRLKTLRKQAEKMQKREEIEENLKDIQRVYYGTKIAKLRGEKEKFNQQKNVFQDQIKEIKNKIFEFEHQLKKESEKENREQGRIGEIQNALKKYAGERRNLDKEVAFLEAKKQSFKNYIEAKKCEIKQLQNPLKKQESLPKEIILKRQEAEEIFALVKNSGLADLDISELPKIICKIKDFFERILKNGAVKEENSLFQSRVKFLEAQIDKEELELAKIIQESVEKEGGLSKLEKEISGLEAEFSTIAENDRKNRKRFFDLEGDIRSERFKLDELSRKENGFNIEESRILIHLEDLEKEAKNELGVVDFSGSSGAENLDLNLGYFLDLEGKIRRLKFQLEQIGGIDELTLQEHKEAEDRFSYLSKEVEDLAKAQEDLLQLIKKLAQDMESGFNNSFEKIARDFEKYFKMIFEGGEAGISFTKISKKEIAGEESGDENVLGSADCELNIGQEGEKEKLREVDEYGVDIFARPAGKKARNLSMLSGGERALTSIALLFAMISSNPLPFCILDEVDAALDEANSARIGKILEELSQKTQFIVITHNRAIMRQASALYGVTMQKDGASKLLSVKLEG
ncbi:MAG: AAA family ATPase [bacterium]